MKTRHLLILILSSAAVVVGTFLEKKYQQEEGLYLRDVGIVGLLVFIVVFYKHLKSKNETSSK